MVIELGVLDKAAAPDIEPVGRTVVLVAGLIAGIDSAGFAGSAPQVIGAAPGKHPVTPGTAIGPRCRAAYREHPVIAIAALQFEFIGWTIIVGSNSDQCVVAAAAKSFTRAEVQHEVIAVAAYKNGLLASSQPFTGLSNQGRAAT
jgi:hypothetical protein